MEEHKLGTQSSLGVQEKLPGGDQLGLELGEGGILRSGRQVGIKMSRRKAFELGELYECLREYKTAWLIF